MYFNAYAKGRVILRDHDHPSTDAKRKQNVKGSSANASPLRFVSEQATEKAASLIRRHTWILLIDCPRNVAWIVHRNGFGKRSNEAGYGNALLFFCD